MDRDAFPSETVSTHVLYPNTLARFERLGVLDTLRAAHDVPLLASRIVGLGHEVAGLYSPIDGFDRAAAPRRSVLDKAIFDTALAAGAEGYLGRRVTGLIGSGSNEDPVRGVTLDDGEQIRARWVFGADGRASTVAARLGLQKKRPQSGNMSLLFAYWRGIPDDGFSTINIEEDLGANRLAVEDGLHLLLATGQPEMTRGSQEDRQRRYLETLRRFPTVIEPDVLDRAQMVSELIAAPESLMRGFFRTSNGPGWALLGDAGHFKHPGTAQGIADAVEQAIYLSEALSSGAPSLAGYEAWREEKAREHYDWSFSWGRFPPAEMEPVFAGWSREEDAGQDLRDSFCRQIEPSQVLNGDRLGRWFATTTA